MRLQGESRRRRRGGGAGWIPAGGGAVAPEVGGVGPHPVHLLRLQLLHPFPRLLVLAPAPSLRASFRKGTGHGSNREDRCRTAAPTTGWRPGAASGGQRGVWQVGEGIGRSREVRAGGRKHPRPRPCTNETTTTGPETHARLHYHVTGPHSGPPVTDTWRAPVSFCLTASVSPFHSTATSAGSVKSVAREETRRLPPSLQISARVHPADFHFQHDGEEEEELRPGGVNPTRRLAPVARCAGEIRAEI